METTIDAVLLPLPTPPSPQIATGLTSPAPISTTPRRRFVWTESMIESLLSLRLSSLLSAFSGSRSVAQIASAWERLRLQFALVHDVTVETAQLKNKYQALRKEYTTITNAASQTGNRTEEPVVFPAYWAVLVQFFGDKDGLGSVDFAQTAHTEETRKRKAEVDAEIARQRQQRRKQEKIDVGQGLVLLGENLAKALVESKGTTVEQTTLGEVVKQQSAMIAAMEQNQRQILEHMESANAVNAALLAFMKNGN